MLRFSPPRNALNPPFHIIAVARLVEKKGIPILINACRILSDRGLDYRCDIIGKGALRGSLEQMIREYDLRDRVQLLGPVRQQEIVPHYQRAHLLVLPCVVGEDGNRDGLPVSIVEALACGVPVISTPITGIPEVVHDGVNGLIVPAGDAAALADAIEKVMRDPELHARLRCAARPSVRDAFDSKKTAERLHQLLEGAEP
jgi:glycosyltransferase involved in cell wall biosynthesis